jgi:hypothetical protein
LRIRLAAAGALLVGACGTTDTNEDVKACDIALGSSSGAVEIGHGGATDFLPVTSGETFPVIKGAQGLWMFVVGARVNDMDIDAGDTAAAWFHAFDPTGQEISLDFNCSERNFEAGDGGVLMKTAFPLAIFPAYTEILSGGNVTLQITVRDRSGQEAMAEVTVVAQIQE